MQVKDYICSIIGRDLTEHEVYSTYQNEYNEWCFKVVNLLTNKITAKGAF